MKDIEWPMEILQNKYTRWYQQIVLRAQQRTLPKDTYIEKHHIIPRSLGGDNSATNLAKLTAREHFICHWLLTKMLPKGKEKGKMINALWSMRRNNYNHERYLGKITSRVFENIRAELAEITRERFKGKPGNIPNKATRLKMSSAKLGKTIPKELNDAIQEKRRLKMLGRKQSEETKLKIGAANKGHYVSEATRKAVSISNKTRIVSEETRKKRSISLRGKHSILTEDQVIEIRTKYVPGQRGIRKTLMKEYNVSLDVIKGVIYNETFKYLLGETK
jgi:hypothetical protein